MQLKFNGIQSDAYISSPFKTIGEKVLHAVIKVQDWKYVHRTHCFQMTMLSLATSDITRDTHIAISVEKEAKYHEAEKGWKKFFSFCCDERNQKSSIFIPIVRAIMLMPRISCLPETNAPTGSSDREHEPDKGWLFYWNKHLQWSCVPDAEVLPGLNMCRYDLGCLICHSSSLSHVIIPLVNCHSCYLSLQLFFERCLIGYQQRLILRYKRKRLFMTCFTSFLAWGWLSQDEPRLWWLSW